MEREGLARPRPRPPPRRQGLRILIRASSFDSRPGARHRRSGLILTKGKSHAPISPRLRFRPRRPRSPWRAARRRPPRRPPPRRAPGAREVPSQLPRNVRPLHYTISATPDAANLRFTGDARRSTSRCWSRPTPSRSTRPSSTSPASPLDGGGERRASRPNADAQTATFRFARPASRRAATASTIAYSGKINTQAAGLFALDYTASEGPKRALFTQFEAPDARRFFPGWDEPNFRTPYDLSVAVPAGQQAIEQHARGAAARRRPDGSVDRPLPDHARHVVLPALPRGRRVRPDHDDRGRRRDRRRHPPRRRRAGPLGARKLGPDRALVQRVFRHALSAAQARQCRRPRHQPVLRRDGELGRDLQLREHPAGRSRDHQRGAAPVDLRGRRARNRPPMVRRPRHHGLVGRSLAERRLRLLDGDQGDRGAPPRMGARCSTGSTAASRRCSSIRCAPPTRSSSTSPRSSRSARPSTRSPTTRARR